MIEDYACRCGRSTNLTCDGRELCDGCHGPSATCRCAPVRTSDDDLDRDYPTRGEAGT